MTVPETQGQVPSNNDKELNFRKQQQMYERMLAEKDARLAEIQAQIQTRAPAQEEDDDEPYVDKKKLGRELSKFAETTKKQTITDIQLAVQSALEQERQNNWLNQNADFDSVMGHAQKLYEKAPGVANAILRMPEGFERQKLVYENIKAMGLDQPERAPSTIQDRVDSNRRSPYYTPSGIGTPAPGAVGIGTKNYSPGDMKNAYDKLQALKNGLRLG